MTDFQFAIAWVYILIGLAFPLLILLQSEDTIKYIKTELQLDGDEFLLALITATFAWPIILVKIILAAINGEL
jgi:hypothetical protein